jgi:multiple sugar transport system ATP-binding protein
MVFQNYALYPHMTAYENIAFPLRLRKVPNDEVHERVDRVVSMLELGEVVQRKPGGLSGGQRQRVAMGRAMVREAEAYLYDEPLSNLDAKLRAQTRTEISRLQHEMNTTTVYVTHDQVEAMTLGDRLALLRKGALQQVGTPKELYEEPVNLFVAGFIGSPQMNFIPAEVQSDKLRTPLVDIPFQSARLPESFRTGHLIVGLRPEDLQPSSQLDERERRSSVTFTRRVDVMEWLGDEQLLYIPFEAPAEIQQQLRELARDLDTENQRTQLIVRLGVDSKTSEGDEIELAFDPADMSLFDGSSGARVEVARVA